MRNAAILLQIVALAAIGLQLSVSLEMSDMKCNKFLYEEQLLEKMVRLEFFVETMEKEMKRMLGDVKAKLAQVEYATSNGLVGNGTSTIQYVDPDSTTIDNLEKKMLQTIDARFNDIENKTFPRLDKKIGDLIRLEQELRSPNVAFAAVNVKSSPLAKRDPVVFTAVLLNDGAGYNTQTGHFVAPISGVYQFHAQLCVGDAHDLEYAIKVETRRIVAGEFRIPGGSNDGKCTSFWAVAMVRQRQTVSVQGWGAQLFNNDNDWNTFSGALLYKVD